MDMLIQWGFWALSLPAVLACIYLFCLTLASARPGSPARSSRRLRFDVLVPAHNESAVIENCVASLRKIDWPAPLFRLIVVADNCDDATAALAAAAGTEVLVRTDPSRRGKGFALQHGFEHSRARGWADAVAIIDADSEVSANILEAFAARIEGGAGAVQAHYGVLNPLQTWRTRLMAIAHGAFHGLRSRARERLGLSCGIRGNGWCVTHAVLKEQPYQAFSLTEDLEYGIDLGLAGIRVHYADEACANAEMAAGEQVASRQRQRWEDGRMDLMRSRAVPLLKMAWRRRSPVCLDLAIDLLIPPLSYVVLYVTALTALAVMLSVWNPAFTNLLLLGLLEMAILTLYVLRGWQLSGLGAAGLLDLLRAPFFVVWKLLLKLRRYDRTEWAPTRRRGP